MKFSKFNNPSKKRHYKRHSSSVSERIKTENAKSALQNLNNMNLRSFVLSLCYENVPGYREANTETKNYIYDAIKNTVLTMPE